MQSSTWSLVKEFAADRNVEVQEADVIQLQQNTHYQFRVVPVLQVAVGNLIEGQPSPISIFVRTRCGGESHPLFYMRLNSDHFVEELHFIFHSSSASHP